MREIVYALDLDKDYLKEKILSWYLNQIRTRTGTSSRGGFAGYFRRDAADLTLGGVAVSGGAATSLSSTTRASTGVARGRRRECAFDALGRSDVAGEAKERQE
ncbi:MAG: transglycosylase domain-containing protein [Dehalococcoidia bacterium]|nr:transglycosylase domain-containing protein [Dehalococcoidia bacterium]